MRTGVGHFAAVAIFALGCAEQAQETRPAANAAESEPPQTSGPTVSEERRDAIERVFARKAAELQSCWSDEYEKTHDRKFETDLTVGFTVTPAGQPQDVKVLSSSQRNASVEACVVKTVTGWGFPEGQAPVPYVRTVHLGAQF